MTVVKEKYEIIIIKKQQQQKTRSPKVRLQLAKSGRLINATWKKIGIS